MSWAYAEIGEVAAMHDVLIHEFSGVRGIREEGALAGALRLALRCIVDVEPLKGDQAAMAETDRRLVAFMWG